MDTIYFYNNFIFCICKTKIIYEPSFYFMRQLSNIFISILEVFSYHDVPASYIKLYFVRALLVCVGEKWIQIYFSLTQLKSTSCKRTKSCRLAQFELNIGQEHRYNSAALTPHSSCLILLTVLTFSALAKLYSARQTM